MIDIKNTPVYRHAQHFAEADDRLTYDSIMRGQKEWGIEGKIASIRAQAVLNMCGKDKTVAGICKVVNPAGPKLE